MTARAEIVAIGDEIVHGQNTDTNSGWLAAEIERLGVEVARFTTVSDVPAEIEAAMRDATPAWSGGGLVLDYFALFVCAAVLAIGALLQPYDNRVRAWARIAKDLPMDKLEAMIQPATLADLPELGRGILQGQVKGRVVVDVNA